VIDNPDTYKHLHIGFKCAAAKGFFVVGPSGEIRTCNHSPHIVGHIFDEEPISDTAYWNMFANSYYLPSECKGCREVYHCDCGCREVANILSGSPCNVDTSVQIKKIY